MNGKIAALEGKIAALEEEYSALDADRKAAETEEMKLGLVELMKSKGQDIATCRLILRDLLQRQERVPGPSGVYNLLSHVDCFITSCFLRAASLSSAS